MKSIVESFTHRAMVLALVLFVPGAANIAVAQLNLVYVNTNIGSVHNRNSVAAYSNDGTGHLTALSGSPYLTGGTGVYLATAAGSYDSDRQVVVSPDGTLLLAVNAHTDSVASFTINSDGSLTAVAGSPFLSNGKDPASLAIFSHILQNNGSILVVVNKDDDPGQNGGIPGYRAFRLSASGVMTPISGTGVNLPARSSPGGAEADLKLRLLFTNEVESSPSTVTSRIVEKDGKIRTVSSVDSPDGLVLLNEVLHPKQNILYSTMPATGGLAVLAFDASGNLSVTNTVANVGNMICWLAINAAGTRLYTGNTGDGTVTVLDTTNPTSPVILQLFQLSGRSPHTTNVEVDPTGHFVYALDGSKLHVLAIAPVDGTLSEVHAVTLPESVGEEATGISTLLK